MENKENYIRKDIVKSVEKRLLKYLTATTVLLIYPLWKL